MPLQHLRAMVGIPGACAALVAASIGAAPLAAQTHAVGAVGAVVGGPQSATAMVAPSVMASVTSSDKIITASFGHTVGLGGQSELNLFVRGSGPLDETTATEPVVLADLSGLRTATKLVGGFSLGRFPWSKDGAAQRGVCRRFYLDREAAPDSVKKLMDEAVRKLPEAAPPERRDSVRASIADSLSRNCIRENLNAAYQREYDTHERLGQVWLFSASGEYGRRTYRYVDTLAVAFRSPTIEAYALSVGAGVYLPKLRVMFAGSLRWERSLDPGTSRQFCVPVGTTGALQCRTVPLAAPTSRDPLLGQLEVRWFATSGVGISPRVTVDLKGDQGWGMELPVLLRQPADKGFTTAVGVGWRSKPTSEGATDQLYLSLTVGVTFGVALK